jgi:Zierdtviridae DNA helicase
VEARITTDGRKILAKIPYANGSGPKWAKKVPGAKADWDKTVEPNVFKGWVYPLTMDTCRAFRKVFGEELVILPALRDWAKVAVAHERELEELREEAIESVTFGRLDREAPDLIRAMSNRRYQIAGTGFLVTSKACILGDDPGLGKTLQTLAALIENDARDILVVCRRTATRTVWERETLRWAPGIATFVAQGSRAEREAVMGEFSDFPTFIPGTRRMLIINQEMVRAKKVEICPESADGKCRYEDNEWNRPADHPKHRYEPEALWPFLFDREWDAIILDESHNLLASTANYMSKRITQQRYGAVMLRRRLRKGGLAIALSGTPFKSKLERAWGSLNWCIPEVFTSYWKWAERYFGVEEGEYGKIVGGTDANGDPVKVLEPKDEDAWDKMLRPYYLKRTKREAAPDLPAIRYAGTPIDGDDAESPCYVQLPMTDANGNPSKQAKLYRQMENEAEVILDGRKMTATGTLPEITRLRQLAISSATLTGDRRSRTMLPALPSNKIEWIVDFMDERAGTGAKVVIASSFTEVVELTARVLREELGLEVLTLTGATSDRDRSDLVARFQDPNDSLSVVVINRKAGGESITLDLADEMIVIDPPWLSDDDEQLNARIHRVSRIHQVIIYRLISSGTYEEWMAKLTDEQRAVVAKASPRKLSEMLKEAREEMAA